MPPNGYLQDLVEMLDERLLSIHLVSKKENFSLVEPLLSLELTDSLPVADHSYLNDLNCFKSLEVSTTYLSDLLLLDEPTPSSPWLPETQEVTANNQLSSDFGLIALDDWEASENYKETAKPPSPEVSRDALSDLLLLNNSGSQNLQRQVSPLAALLPPPRLDSITTDILETSCSSSTSSCKVSVDTFSDLLLLNQITNPPPQYQFSLSSSSNIHSSPASVVFTTGDSNSSYKGRNTSSPPSSNTPSTSNPQQSTNLTMSDDNFMSMESPAKKLRRMSAQEVAMSTEAKPAQDFSFVNLSIVEQALQDDLQHKSSTALASRTTEDVIADLRRPSKHYQADLIPEKQPQVLDLELSVQEHKAQIITNNEEDPDDLDLQDDDDDDHSDSADPGAVPKQRKITERKRRLNALAENYLQELNQKIIKGDKKVSMEPEEEAQQSARWLVNQSENREIISSPREYQLELFEKAKEKNVIAVLDTGSGKTLIAVLLLRHIFAQELEDRSLGKPHRISVFLVDSVQLVFQQHAVLKANLDQPMNMFCGDMGTDNWKAKSWAKHFSENMVIVCTAEVLRQCLHHSFISMDRINLLIFDEAHHAKKDHPYARIIKDFYVPQLKEDRDLVPKIFGMTASPVDARVDVKRAAEELEAILYCEIATAADLSLLQYTIKSKQEQLLYYKPLGSVSETPLWKEMESRFKLNGILSKPLLFAKEATRELGTWCADQVWPFCLTDDETKKLQAKTERKYHAKQKDVPLAVLEEQKAQIQEARDIVKSHIFEAPIHLSNQKNLSSKVAGLVLLLKERFQRPTEDKCIVFVRQRYTARLLAKLFSHETVGTPHLHVGTLVGTRAGEAGDLRVSFREQVLTMMNFRKGNINCLFATSVAEEGLDIPDCNLVIRFDLYSTLIQYIQSRGRARHVNSRYIHMLEEGNWEHKSIVSEVRQNEHKIKEFCAALPEDRKLKGNDVNMDAILSKESNHRVYKIPETGAKLTYKMSLMVLVNFVSSLPQAQQEVNLQAEFVVTVQKKQFVCEVIMPEASPIRGAVGRPATTKQVAKCSAAFETCLDLVRGKYLDKYLLPTFTKSLPTMRNAVLAVDSKKREAYDMKTKPKLWSTPGPSEDVMFVTIISVGNPDALDRPSQPLALLTRNRIPDLPSFFLHFGQNRHSSVILASLTEAMKVTPELIQKFNTFTLCIFDDVFSKLYEPTPAKMPYFLVPVKKDQVQLESRAVASAIIDWDVITSVAEHLAKWAEAPWDNDTWKVEPDEFFTDKYIVDPYDGSRKLWSKGVTQKYKPLDPVPPNTAPRTGQRMNNANIMEYSISLWQKARARREFDTNQRVIEAEFISLRRNLLDEFAAPEAESPKRCFVMLQALWVSPLPTTVVAMAYNFPAIIHRIESYLIALEAAELLHLTVRPDLALEAVTKDSDNTNDHNGGEQEQVNFQRGMGNNYERLEFLGDCFLKMATSISLYGLHPDNDEYRYHVDRMLLICNKNLKNNAIKLKLYEYIRSQSFNRRAWYPEGLVLKKGKTALAPDSHKLGDKSIADVCEAFIGAALLTCHDTGDMDNAVRAVTEVVCSDNHNVLKYADYYKLYTKPRYQLAQATAMQLDLAKKVEAEHPYHFKYPRLVRSVFTHSSYPFSYEQVPCYQRLEFLGDSLLDMACVNFLFHNFPGKDPQWLTEHKMAMVSNQFLGALCVKLGFHTHVLHFNSSLAKQIADYVTDITEAQLGAERDALRDGKAKTDCARDYWLHVRQPPKCLPDVVEAFIGALFVDSEYDYSEVVKFFEMHVKWYFEDMHIYDTFANKHPTTFLSKFLQINMGCQDWSILTKEQKAVDGSKPSVVAMVIVHGEVVVHSVAESSRYAKVNAAKKAVVVLDGLPIEEFRGRYGCECHPEEVEGGVVVPGGEKGDLEEMHGTAV